MVLPAGMADAATLIEHRIAPPVYRRSRIVTLSSSSKPEIVERLQHPARPGIGVPPGGRGPVHPRR